MPIDETPRQTPPVSDDEARWSAVKGANRAGDGSFVYAVRTTGSIAGVVCGPACAA